MRVNVAAGERTLYPVDQITQIVLTAFEGDSMGRALVQLADPDVTHMDEWTETTDLLTGHTVAVRRADCGLGCKCAAEVKLVELNEKEEEDG